MRVVVPALESDCIAHRALTAEGIEHEEFVCEGDTGYAAKLAALWREGEGFVVVEHDVAPWVGAVEELEECPHDWCQFRYPEGGFLTQGLGCTKLSDRVVREHPDLWEAWEDTDWCELDGAVGTAVGEYSALCVHDPPVAHVRGPD